MWIRLPAIIALVGIIGFLYFWQSEQESPGSVAGSGPTPTDSRPLPADDPLPAGKDGLGDSPQARYAWELMRQRDPATGRIPRGIHRREREFASSLPRRDPGRSVADEVAIRAGGKSGLLPGWAYRGPFNIGGRTRALAIDLADPTQRTLLAGGVSGGMWRSTDDGASWYLTTGTSQLHSVTCLVQDPRPGKQHVWYYGTGEGHGGSTRQNGDLYRGDGIFKSLDGGLSWDLLPSTSTGIPQETDKPLDYVWKLAIDTSNETEDEIYAATWGAVYRSLDGGGSWTPVLGAEVGGSKYSDVIVTSAGVVYASLSSDGVVAGIYRSADGIEWAELTPGSAPGYGRIVLAVAPSREEIVYALVSWTEDSSLSEFWRYFYLSGDGSGSGGYWLNRSQPMHQLPHPYGWGVNWDLWTQRGYNLTLAVNPDDANLVYVGGVHLWRNPTGFGVGNATDRIGGFYYDDLDLTHHADNHLLIFQPGSNVAYSANDGGVYRTEDIEASRVEWTSLNNGYNTTQFYTVAIDQKAAGNPVIVGGTQDHGTFWTNVHSPEAHWTKPLGGDGSFCAVADAAADTGTYYLSWYWANIMRMRIDGEGNVVAETKVKPLDGGDFLFINPFILDPVDSRVMYLGSEGGVWRNDDLTGIPMGSWDETSVNWVRLTDFPQQVHVTALAMGQEGNRVLYFGTGGGGLYRLAAAHEGDGRTSVELYHGAGFPDGGFVSDIAVHPEDYRKVLVCFGNYRVASLWYSVDAGRTWTDVEGNLAGDDGPSVRALAILPVAGGEVFFVGTSTGLYTALEMDGAATVWVQEAAEQIGNVIVDDLTCRPADGLVVAATHGRGVFSVNLPVDFEIPGSPPSLILDQNTPNPFNAGTDISFDLPVAGHAELDILDLRGILVRRIFAENRPEGRQNAHWDGRNEAGNPVASGTYLYRLRGGRWEESRKLSVVR